MNIFLLNLSFIFIFDIIQKKITGYTNNHFVHYNNPLHNITEHDKGNIVKFILNLQLMQ